MHVMFLSFLCAISRPPLPESSMEKMKRFKRRLSQTLRGSHTIDESLSELAEQMTIEENGLKDSGENNYIYWKRHCIFEVVKNQKD